MVLTGYVFSKPKSLIKGREELKRIGRITVKTLRKKNVKSNIRKTPAVTSLYYVGGYL